MLKSLKGYEVVITDAVLSDKIFMLGKLKVARAGVEKGNVPNDTFYYSILARF